MGGSPEDIPYRREDRYDLSFDDWEQQVHTDEMYSDMLSNYERQLIEVRYEIRDGEALPYLSL